MKSTKVLFWNSLRFRMPGIVLLGIISPMLGAIFYAGYRADLQLREHAKEDIADHAGLLVNTLSWWNQMNVSSLKQLSDQVNILNNAEQQKLMLKSFVNNNPNLYLAAIVNLNGRTMVSSSNNSRDYGDRPWFLGAKLGKEVTYQTLIGRSIGKPAVCMSRPIRNEQSEIISVGLLCSELLNLARQFDRLKFGRTGYAILVDETGNVLAHPNTALISGNKLYNLHRYPPVKNILESREGYFSYVNEENIKWISYGTSLENNWKVVLVQQEKEFLQNEQAFKSFVRFEALTAVIFVSILTWLLANYLIHPIGQLTNVATAISNGDLDRKVEVKRQDELGILVASFNQMVSRLKTLFIELEDQVKQRTSELNTAKEVAESANQTKNKFLARISHELRSPLNNIINYATVLERNFNLAENNYSQVNYDDRSQNKKASSIIRQSGIHLLELIEDILDFSSAKVSQIELYPTYTNWQQFLERIIAMVELDAQEKNLLVEYETVGDLSRGVWVDQKRLQQVLINLLNNAIKFTDQGKVTLKIIALRSAEDSDRFYRHPQQKFRFEVIDTGRGINSKDLKKIFQPFEQIGTTEQQRNGIGLGLSISRQIVATMGGKLNAKSQLGLGSIFWFDIDLIMVDDFVAETDHEEVGKALPPDSSGYGQIDD